MNAGARDLWGWADLRLSHGEPTHDRPGQVVSEVPRRGRIHLLNGGWSGACAEPDLFAGEATRANVNTLICNPSSRTSSTTAGFRSQPRLVFNLEDGQPGLAH